MSSGGTSLRNSEVMEIHKSIIEMCKKNKEFKKWFLENGAKAEFPSTYDLDFISDENYEEYPDKYIGLTNYLNNHGLTFEDSRYAVDEDGAIYDYYSRIVDKDGVEVLDRFVYELWLPDYDTDDGLTIAYPKEMVYHPLVIRNLMYTSDEYDSREGYRAYIIMGVTSDDIDFNEFAPSVLKPKYKWSKPNKLNENWGNLIEDMYFNSGATLPSSEYCNVIIKISMIDNNLCYTFYSGEGSVDVIHYYNISSDLCKKMLNSLPVDKSKVKEVYILCNTEDFIIESYIARKCNDGEYVLTLF